MCSQAGQLNLGDKTVTISCRKCDQCVAARKRHWIGRINAEAETAKSVTFATFTYDGGYDRNEAYYLKYSDFQRLIKRLRRRGYRFTYVAVGEYGSKASRAHFHALFFWDGPEPPVPYDHRIPYAKNPCGQEQNIWPDGFIQFERPRSRQACAAYLMDYLDKDNVDCLKYSKVPALGEKYLIEYAQKLGRCGLTLFRESDRYTIPSNTRANGQLFYYPVGRDTAIYRRMIAAFCSAHYASGRTGAPRCGVEVSEYLWDYSQDLCATDPLEIIQACHDLFGSQAIQDGENLGHGYFGSEQGEIYLTDAKGSKIWEAHIDNGSGDSQSANLLRLLRLKFQHLKTRGYLPDDLPSQNLNLSPLPNGSLDTASLLSRFPEIRNAQPRESKKSAR